MWLLWKRNFIMWDTLPSSPMLPPYILIPFILTPYTQTSTIKLYRTLYAEAVIMTENDFNKHKHTSMCWRLAAAVPSLTHTLQCWQGVKRMLLSTMTHVDTYTHTYCTHSPWCWRHAAAPAAVGADRRPHTPPGNRRVQGWRDMPTAPPGTTEGSSSLSTQAGRDKQEPSR